jgi:hypothetical protein
MSFKVKEKKNNNSPQIFVTRNATTFTAEPCKLMLTKMLATPGSLQL